MLAAAGPWSDVPDGVRLAVAAALSHWPWRLQPWAEFRVLAVTVAPSLRQPEPLGLWV